MLIITRTFDNHSVPFKDIKLGSSFYYHDLFFVRLDMEKFQVYGIGISILDGARYAIDYTEQVIPCDIVIK